MQAKEMNGCFAKLFALVSIIWIPSLALAGKNEVVICHYPPSGDAPSTISVAASSVPAHLAHGDVEGACPEQAQVDTPEAANDPEVVTESETVTEPDVVTEEVATEEVASEEVATEEVATEEVATEEVATEEVATEEVVTEEVVTEEVVTEEVVTEAVVAEESSNQVAENSVPVEPESEIARALGGNEEHHASTAQLGPNNQIGSLTPEQLQEQLASFMMIGIDGGCSQSPHGNSSSTFLLLSLAIAFLFFKKRTEVVKQ